MENQTVTHWLFRVGDGEHFISSSKQNIWGIVSSNSFGKYFIGNAKEGDVMWFVKSNSNGLLMAVATFTGIKKREVGPLVCLTATNEELGWTKTDGTWDTEVHYSNLYNLMSCGLFSSIKCPSTIRTYNADKCKVNLPVEYASIVRYSNLSQNM